MNFITIILSFYLVFTQTECLGDHNVTSSNYTPVYNPSAGTTDNWYINDHTFIKDHDGVWHLFGITHTEPADPDHEIQFAHAIAPQLSGPWVKQPFALTVDYKYFGETHLWAPHVIQVNGTYHMFYNGGGSDATNYAINLATSKDLYNWTRLSTGPIFRDGVAARDPMVIQINNLWHLFYCANKTPKGGNNVVAYRTSTDLIHWSDRGIAFDDTTNGPTESPFVVHRNDWYYLFTGPRGDYRNTDVFRSKNPTNFTLNDRIGKIASHAAEVLIDENAYWVSHCGWGQGGVHIASLFFDY